jgi:hypothetical protein
VVVRSVSGRGFGSVKRETSQGEVARQKDAGRMEWLRWGKLEALDLRATTVGTESVAALGSGSPPRSTFILVIIPLRKPLFASLSVRSQPSMYLE